MRSSPGLNTTSSKFFRYFKRNYTNLLPTLDNDHIINLINVTTMCTCINFNCQFQLKVIFVRRSKFTKGIIYYVNDTNTLNYISNTYI